MKAKKCLLVAAFSALMLTACATAPKGRTPYKPDLPTMDDAIKAEFEELLAIRNADGIRGNIYMPTELDGAEITWFSSDVEVITDEEQDGMAPGVVTRYDEDQNVKLTATVVKDGQYCMIEQDVKVLADQGAPTDDDYVGYLLVTFTGEGSANGEQVYMSLADEGEGFNFKELNNNKAILTSIASEKGVRDPFVYRSPEGDRFFIIATDLKINNRKNPDGTNGGWANTSHGYTFPTVNGTHTLILWETSDLSDWGEPRYIPVADGILAEAAGLDGEQYPNGGAGMAWAPEMTYNYETGEYVIFWSSCYIDDLTKKDNDKIKAKGDAVYRCTTRDFEHFGTPTLFIDNQLNKNGTPRNIIDATCRKIGDYYYSITKDGDNGDREGGILIQRSQDILDINAWEKVCSLADLGLPTSGTGVNAFNNQTLEGPALFPFNKCDWADENTPEYCIMGDAYNTGAGYLPFSTTDIEDADNANQSWKVLAKTDYSWGNGGKRHGSVLQLTADDLETIKNSPIYGF